MRFSIVMTYFNRRKQLLNTLETIKYFGGDYEIWVVDDGSSERIDDIPGIHLIRIEPEDKKWVNPCIPFNIGFAHAEGDCIIIQNPECLYTGDILKYASKIKKGQMLSFGAYSLDRDLQGELLPEQLKKMIMNEPQKCQFNHSGWYNHSVHRPAGFHFCNAILRGDLEAIGGFDERYANGIGFDDNDLVERIKRNGMNISIIDDPFVIHQKHERTDYRIWRDKRAENYRLFNEVTLKETCVKPPNNIYYK